MTKVYDSDGNHFDIDAKMFRIRVESCTNAIFRLTFTERLLQNLPLFWVHIYYMSL